MLPSDVLKCYLEVTNKIQSSSTGANSNVTTLSQSRFELYKKNNSFSKVRSEVSWNIKHHNLQSLLQYMIKSRHANCETQALILIYLIKKVCPDFKTKIICLQKFGVRMHALVGCFDSTGNLSYILDPWAGIIIDINESYPNLSLPTCPNSLDSFTLARLGSFPKPFLDRYYDFITDGLLQINIYEPLYYANKFIIRIPCSTKDENIKLDISCDAELDICIDNDKEKKLKHSLLNSFPEIRNKCRIHYESLENISLQKIIQILVTKRSNLSFNHKTSTGSLALRYINTHIKEFKEIFRDYVLQNNKSINSITYDELIRFSIGMKVEFIDHNIINNDYIFKKLSYKLKDIFTTRSIKHVGMRGLSLFNDNKRLEVKINKRYSFASYLSKDIYVDSITVY